MAQVIILDYATGKVQIFIYDKKTYPEIDALLGDLYNDEKISNLSDCYWMCSDEDIEIEYETV